MVHSQMRGLDVYELGILAYVAVHGVPAVSVRRVEDAFVPMTIVDRLGGLVQSFRMLRVPLDTSGDPMHGYVALTNEGREYLESYGERTLHGIRAMRNKLGTNPGDLHPDIVASKKEHLRVTEEALAAWVERRSGKTSGPDGPVEDLNQVEVDRDLVESADPDILVDRVSGGDS